MSTTLSTPAPTATHRTPNAWDIVLDPTPRAEYDPGAPRRLSPRAAFQDLLHERVVLIDLRDTTDRARDGEVAGQLGAHRLPATELDTWLAAHEGDVTEVVLLCTDGSRSAGALRFLRRRYAGIDIADVAGGFQAWAAAGLPTTQEPGDLRA